MGVQPAEECQKCQVCFPKLTMQKQVGEAVCKGFSVYFHSWQDCSVCSGCYLWNCGTNSIQNIHIMPVMGTVLFSWGEIVGILTIFITSGKSCQTEVRTALLHDTSLAETNKMLSSTSNAPVFISAGVIKGRGVGLLRVLSCFCLTEDSH